MQNFKVGAIWKLKLSAKLIALLAMSVSGYFENLLVFGGCTDINAYFKALIHFLKLKFGNILFSQ